MIRHRISLFILSAAVLLPTAFVAAQEGGFVTIVGLPHLEPNNQSSEAYINALYRIAISMAALLAFIKLILAGAKYMLTDVVTTKEAAKKDVRGAVIGLLIVLCAVLILETINPNLTRLDVLRFEQLGTAATDRPPRTVCEIDPDSQACCTSRGGQYSRVSGVEHCSGGVVDLPATGDEVGDALSCRSSGTDRFWDPDAGVCLYRNVLENVSPPPTEYQLTLDLLGITENEINAAHQFELNQICQNAGFDGSYRWLFDIDTKSCVGIPQ